jgi:hypothetical protein
MRIDLTPQGKVVGTRKVSENGQVTGLSEHAGQDVLILVPNGTPVVRNTMADYVHEWQRIAERNAKRAAKEWQSFQKKVPRSRQAALKLAKEQIEFARDQLAVERLVKAAPVVQARRNVEKRIKRARKQVLHAQTWLRARMPAAPASRNGRKTSKAAA